LLFILVSRGCTVLIGGFEEQGIKNAKPNVEVKIGD
jgi:hypothetical protein